MSGIAALWNRRDLLVRRGIHNGKRLVGLVGHEQPPLGGRRIGRFGEMIGEAKCEGGECGERTEVHFEKVDLEGGVQMEIDEQNGNDNALGSRPFIM